MPDYYRAQGGSPLKQLEATGPSATSVQNIRRIVPGDCTLLRKHDPTVRAADVGRHPDLFCKGPRVKGWPRSIELRVLSVVHHCESHSNLCRKAAKTLELLGHQPWSTKDQNHTSQPSTSQPRTPNLRPQATKLKPKTLNPQNPNPQNPKTPQSPNAPSLNPAGRLSVTTKPCLPWATGACRAKEDKYMLLGLFRV